MSETIMGLLNPAIATIFASIFAALWMRDKNDKSALVFAIGHLFLASGFLIFHFSPDPEAVTWTLLMHAIYSVSTGCMCWGAAARVGQDLKITPLVLITVIASGLIVASSFGTDMNARLVATNTAYGLVFALAAQIVGRASKSSVVDHAIFWLLAITAAQFFIRPQLAVILGGPMSADAYRESGFYAVLMLFMGIFSLLLALTLVAATVHDQWRAEREKAEIDPLSKLKIRHSFETSAMQMLEKNVERDLPISIIVADIDHFKRVNDIWGHQAGDKAIAAFGELIGGTVRGTDLCGRIGGEEFCILVHDCEMGPAKGLAERLRRKFERLEHEDIGSDIRLTASFGVTEWRTGEGYGKLFARADAALYSAKNEGRNQVRTCSDGPTKPAEPSEEPAAEAQPVSLAS